MPLGCSIVHSFVRRSPSVVVRAVTGLACSGLLPFSAPPLLAETPLPSRVALHLMTAATHADTVRAGLKWHECLVKAMQGQPSTIGTPADLRELLFPLLEAEAGPPDDSALHGILARKEVRDRLLASGYTHVLALHPEVERAELTGPFLCGGPTGPGCLGASSGAERTRARAWLWDITTTRVVEEIRTEAEGRNVAIGLLIPIIVRAGTDQQVCLAIAQRIEMTLRESRR